MGCKVTVSMQNGEGNESGANAILGINIEVEPSLGRPDSLEWFEYLD